jgi:hypothetical protein
MKKLTIILVVLLSGCANLHFQWSASYRTDNLASDLVAIRHISTATGPITSIEKTVEPVKKIEAE